MIDSEAGDDPKRSPEWTSIIVNIPLLVITLFVLGTGLAHGDDYPDCEVTKESQISFSSEDAADRLSITISGSPCFESSLDISITANDGRLLYHYEAPFAKHLVAPWEDPAILAEEVEWFANRVLGQESVGHTSDLPVWLPEDEYFDANYQVIQVDRDYYEEIREYDWIVYTHNIHYDGWRVIAYDQQQARTVVVSAAPNNAAPLIAATVPSPNAPYPQGLVALDVRPGGCCR